MSQQPSLAAMCEVYLAEIDNGRRGGFPVETLAIPHVIRAKMESMDLPVAIDDLPFDRVVEMVEQFQREEKVAAMKARRAKKNPQFGIVNSPKKSIEMSPVKKTKGVAESKRVAGSKKIVEKPRNEASVVPKIVEKSQNTMDSVEHDVEMMEELVVESVEKIAEQPKEKPPAENVMKAEKPTAEPKEKTSEKPKTKENPLKNQVPKLIDLTTEEQPIEVSDLPRVQREPHVETIQRTAEKPKENSAKNSVAEGRDEQAEQIVVDLTMDSDDEQTEEQTEKERQVPVITLDDEDTGEGMKQFGPITAEEANFQWQLEMFESPNARNWTIPNEREAEREARVAAIMAHISF